MAADDKMDMSLSDIIKQDRQQKRGGGGRGRGGRGGSGSGRGGVGGGGGGGGGGGVGHFGGPTRGGPVRYRGRGRPTLYRPKWHYNDFNAGAGSGGGWPGGVETGGKLVVSNLHFDVSDSDIFDVFTSVGTLKKAAVRRDHNGKSLGVADVHFEEKEDALEAMKQYHSITLDGRAMHIKSMDAQFERQRRPPMQGANKRGGGMHWNRFDGGMQNMSRSQRRRNQWPQQSGLSAKNLDAQIDAYHNMMDTS